MLLMHFFDSVFPLQFPLYRPDGFDGRGWLLALLQRSRPLYHAALALSGYLRGMRFFGALSDGCRVAVAVTQTTHLAASLEEVRRAMGEISTAQGGGDVVGTFGSVVQLVFFEVRGGGLLRTCAH
jgi:hypothetical protein